METRNKRGLKVTRYVEPKLEIDDTESNDFECPDDIRKSKIRDCNKEFAKRMTILQAWSDHWSDYTTREGDAYPPKEAKIIIKRAKKITCPIPSCRKVFTTIGGLRYHYARCNIERCFRCNVCNPSSQHKTRGDLLKHMVREHFNDLPELEKDQKEIAQGYFISDRPERPKTKRVLSDGETVVSCYSFISSYNDLIDKTFAQENFSKCPFKEWKTFGRDWELLTYEIDRRRYYPPEKESPKFKMPNSEWNIVNTGGSVVLKSTKEKNSPKSMIFYTGGINTASAWLPKPPNDNTCSDSPDILAISVNCCPMEQSFPYKDSRDFVGCIQFWSTNLIASQSKIKNIEHETETSISFMVAQNYGSIYDMTWCPLGTSWESKLGKDGPPQEHIESQARMGLLALACGDGKIRILSVPHLDSIPPRTVIKHTFDPIEIAPIFRVKPIATLMPPGVGPSTDYQMPACTAIHWDLENNQRLIAAGYSNGSVAVFDLANYSPILYSTCDEQRHIYQPLKSWFAHGLAVSGVAISSKNIERTIIVTGSRDKQVKMWNLTDLNSCLTNDRAPITKISWDYRLRGIVAATESAFNSFQNRVSYRFPTLDGFTGSTISVHRATVWGLASSVITSALATSDEAGEVFVCPIGKPAQRRDKSHFNTHSLYTLLPKSIDSQTAGRNAASQLPDTRASSDYVYMDVNQPDPTSLQLEITNDGDATMNDNDDSNDYSRVVNDYSFTERVIANKPSKFLLPIDYPAVETYANFKKKFGLEYVNYDTKIPMRKEQRLPKSCLRANDTSNIYCGRHCDYPFCSIKDVSWSPNLESFSCLLSVSRIGLCRLESVTIVEQVFGSYVASLCESKSND